jgi:hypothetical protein
MNEAARDRMLIPLRGGRLNIDLWLLLILLAAAALRFNGLDWGWTDFSPRPLEERPERSFYAFHPDEASNIRAARNFSASEDWRPTGELYGQQVDYSLYGASTVYLHAMAVTVAGWFWDFEAWAEDGGRSQYLTWMAVRWLTALLGLGCLPLLYLAALRLYDRPTARLAAALLAFAAFHAQSGRFGTVDIPMVFFSLWSFAHLAVLVRRDSWPHRLLAALAAGLAVSTKINALVLLAPLLTAEVLRGGWPPRLPGEGWRWTKALAGLLLRRLAAPGPLAAVAVVVGVFALLNPYAFLDWRNYLFADHAFGLVHILRNVRGEFFYPFQIQFQDIRPLPFLVGNVLLWAAGPALLAAGLAALPWMAWRRRPGDWVLLVWLLPALAATVGAKVLFMRYALPFLPLLALAAAVPLVELGRATRPGLRRAGLGLTLLVLLPSALWTRALASVHDNEDSRIVAGRWLAANLPVGSALLHERSANSIKPVIHMPDYHNVCLEIPTVLRADGSSDADKLDFLGAKLREVEFAAILESNRRLGFERSSRYPAERLFYQALFAGGLGFVADTVIHPLPRVLGLAIDDEAAEFSLRYYDHEEIHLFRKRDAAALEQGLAALKARLVRDPRSVDSRLSAARTALARGDLGAARSEAIALLDGAVPGDSGPRGSAEAFSVLAAVFAAGAERQAAAGEIQAAQTSYQEAERFHGLALRDPGAVPGREARALAWLRFRDGLGEREAARDLLAQLRAAGLRSAGIDSLHQAWSSPEEPR